MDNLLKELTSQLKSPNDSKIQLKAVSILNEILELMKKSDKKKLNDCQQSVEETLSSYIQANRANNDICIRYIYYIYRYLFDFGHSSRLNEFIAKFSTMLTSSKTTTNIKCTCLWLMGKVCSKSNYKSQQLSDLLHLLIKTIKNTNELSIKNEAFATMSKLLNLKLPNFYNQLNDTLKIIFKQEKYSITESKCKKNILKALNSSMFYLNSNSVPQHYENFINFITKNLDDEDSNIRKFAINVYIDLHVNKIFDQNIDLTKIMRKKSGEQLKNFLEVLLYFGNFFTNKTEGQLNLKISYIHILKILFEKYIDTINSSESLITKIYGLLLAYFQINYVGFINNNNINYKQNLVNINNPTNHSSLALLSPQYSTQNRLNTEIEELYRLYIKLVYHASYRKTLLKQVFKKLTESQSDLDKIENLQINLKTSVDTLSKKKKKDGPEEKEREKFTEFHVNAMLISLIEFSESNYDLFEITYKSFQDISQNLVVYLISSVKSFRMLMNRVLINLAYWIPAWRIPIVTLILNLSSVAHAEVAALKNVHININNL